LAILNPDHLLEQARRLIRPGNTIGAGSIRPKGAPRQVDLRRAVSSAYYSVFHLVAAALADQFVGVTFRPARNPSQIMQRYGAAYRAFSHKRLGDLCVDLARQTPPRKYDPHLPRTKPSPDRQLSAAFVAFAEAVVQLQEARHDADYNPVKTFRRSDAVTSVAVASLAIALWRGRGTMNGGSMTADDRAALLTLLLFDPR
jgi:hypothetical protein